MKGPAYPWTDLVYYLSALLKQSSVETNTSPPFLIKDFLKGHEMWPQHVTDFTSALLGTFLEMEIYPELTIDYFTWLTGKSTEQCFFNHEGALLKPDNSVW